MSPRGWRGRWWVDGCRQWETASNHRLDIPCCRRSDLVNLDLWELDRLHVYQSGRERPTNVRGKGERAINIDQRRR